MCIGAEIGEEGCDDMFQEIRLCNTQACRDELPCEDSLFDVAFLVEGSSVS